MPKAKKTKSEEKWSEKDFVEDLDTIMKEQELNNPKLKRVHAKLDPSFKETVNLITQLLMNQDEDIENHLVQKILDLGNKALYPLIETVLAFKKLKKPT